MAWNKIEKGLDQRKGPVNWFSIAASITFLVVSAFTYLQLFHQDHQEGIAQNKIVLSPAKQKSAEPPAEQEIKKASTIETAGNEAAKKTKQQPAGAIAKMNNDFPRKVEVKDENIAAPVDNRIVPVDTASQSFALPSQLAFKAPAKEETVTIVLTADQTREYLTSKNSTTQATSIEKKSSTFRKLLKKAADLKVNQDPFGELRQKKNEILALNFRSEKQRGQKK